MAGMERERAGAGNGKVFISHAHEDNARCAPLLAALRRWGVDYWFDTESITGGQDLSRGIQTAIAERDVLLRICTPAAQRSYWVQLETGAFRALQAQDHREGGDRRRLVNVILDAGYRREPFDLASLYIDATGQPEAVWLEELRRALGIAEPAAPAAAVAAPIMEAAPVAAMPIRAVAEGSEASAVRAGTPSRPSSAAPVEGQEAGGAPGPRMRGWMRAPTWRVGMVGGMSVALLVAAFVGLLGLNGNHLFGSAPGATGTETASASHRATATPSPNITATLQAKRSLPYKAARPGGECDTEHHAGGTALWQSSADMVVDCLAAATRLHVTFQNPGGTLAFQPTAGRFFFAVNYTISVTVQLGASNKGSCASLFTQSDTAVAGGLATYSFELCPDGTWSVRLAEPDGNYPDGQPPALRSGNWNPSDAVNISITKTGGQRTFKINGSVVYTAPDKQYTSTAYLGMGFNLPPGPGIGCGPGQCPTFDDTATFSNWDYEPAA